MKTLLEKYTETNNRKSLKSAMDVYVNNLIALCRNVTNIEVPDRGSR